MMKNVRYLIRLDDACPTMDKKKWNRIEEILNRYDILPMVGIVPKNMDPKLVIDKSDISFWEAVQKWKEKGWAIALHGYNHLFKSDAAGINPFWNRSEFAGLSLDTQKKMITEGLAEFKKNNLSPIYFFAPGHTFDENTIKALRECSSIRIISDTIAFRPYSKGDFVFIPQFMGHCVNMPFSGTYTFCLHPNIMIEKDFQKLDRFLNKNKERFISFSSINVNSLKPKSVFDLVLSNLYFYIRDLKGLRKKDDLRRRKVQE